MKGLVLDCSVTMAWRFEDATTPYTDAVLERLETGHAFVPSIWPLEVASVLTKGERMNKLTPADSSRFISFLAGLPIQVDEQAHRDAFGALLTLSRRYQITVYDAAYLELASRLNMPLATQDGGLKQAASSGGAALFS